MLVKGTKRQYRITKYVTINNTVDPQNDVVKYSNVLYKTPQDQI